LNSKKIPLNTTKVNNSGITGAAHKLSFFQQAAGRLVAAIWLIASCVLSSNQLHAQSPTITSFSPSDGPVGTLITVTGTNLGNPTAFTIGSTTAVIVSNTGTQLVGLVMPGSNTGLVSLITAGGSANSAANFTVSQTAYPDLQQGAKLIGTGVSGAAAQGSAVSISADGNTAIAGGSDDDNGIGAAWVYLRSGGVWMQQGNKLVGTGVTDTIGQGQSVSISADGNTVMIGGSDEDKGTGAVWIYTRSAGIWTQQGGPLPVSGAKSGASIGSSVSLSADGQTAILGGDGDNGNIGGAWVFTLSSGVWTQEGGKLLGTGSIGASWQGSSVSLSADGNTAAVGGSGDSSQTGAVWVYTRTAGAWTQEGTKLVGTGAAGRSYLGESVSLSADGNTLLVGADGDSSNAGAAWVFTRSGGSWTQVGSKLVGTGTVGPAWQGLSVSLSADGNTAMVGGNDDNTQAGAIWVYTRSSGVWTQQGNKMIGSGASDPAYQGHAVSISADGNTAISGGFNDNNGEGAAWIFVSTASQGIQQYTEAGMLQVYPNPNTGSFSIHTSRKEGIYSLFNELGQTIRQYRLTGSNDYTQQIGDLNPGIYFIVGLTGRQQISQKVIVTQ
jgi:hypothetical protein